ncbi:MAG: hypothetical protein MHMPM18_004060 [Marteilia pararefringens]
MIDNNNLNETSEIDDFSSSSTNQRNCITIEGLEKIGRNEFCRAFFDQITSRLFTANSNSPEVIIDQYDHIEVFHLSFPEFIFSTYFYQVKRI